MTGKIGSSTLKELSRLVEDAVGNRTVNRFAGDSGLDRKLILDIINKKINKFPQPIELKRMADASEDRITYNELRVLCGYPEDTDKYIINLKDFFVKRGEIYYANLDGSVDSEMGNIRPVLILQNDIGNKYSTNILIATITTKTNKGKYMPTHVNINYKCGLPEDSVIQLEHLRTISKGRLLYNGYVPEPIGNASEEIMKKVKYAAEKEMGFIDLNFNIEDIKEKYAYLQNIMMSINELEKKDTTIDLISHRRLQNYKKLYRGIFDEIKDYCRAYDKDYKEVINSITYKKQQQEKYKENCNLSPSYSY